MLIWPSSGRYPYLPLKHDNNSMPRFLYDNVNVKEFSNVMALYYAGTEKFCLSCTQNEPGDL